MVTNVYSECTVTWEFSTHLSASMLPPSPQATEATNTFTPHTPHLPSLLIRHTFLYATYATCATYTFTNSPRASWYGLYRNHFLVVPRYILLHEWHQEVWVVMPQNNLHFNILSEIAVSFSPYQLQAAPTLGLVTRKIGTAGWSCFVFKNIQHCWISQLNRMHRWAEL